MADFALLVALLVIFAALVRPEWVHNRRAFGWGVALSLAALLLLGLGIPAWLKYGGWYVLVGVAYVLLRVGLITALLCAFWPGGGLFEMGGKTRAKEELT